MFDQKAGGLAGRTRKISFGGVTETLVARGKLVGHTSTLRPISDRVHRTMASCDFFNRCIYGILASDVKVCWWGTSAIPYGAGTPRILREILQRYRYQRRRNSPPLLLTICKLREDMRALYSKIKLGKDAFLDYKRKIRVRPLYHEVTRNPIRRSWEWNGYTKPMAPRLRLYLLRVLEDPFTAATSIQTVWRQHRAYSIFRTLQKTISRVLVTEDAHIYPARHENN